MPEDDKGPVAVSVIIPVLNGGALLSRCLDALRVQTVDRSSYEVIVVDDGSTDDSAEVAERQGAQVIRQAHTGAAEARNRGARQAAGSILLFTDADCAPTADWVERMLEPFSDPEVAGVKGAYCTRQRAVVARFAQAEYEEKYDRLLTMNRIDFVDTYSAGYRREVLVQGGFDPDFLLDEDQELSYRLAAAGFKLVFAPKAVVCHEHPATVKRYVWRKIRLGRWKVRVAARYPSTVLHDSYTPWTQKAQLLLLPLAAAAAVAALVGMVSWLLMGTLLILGLLTALPIMIKAAHQGWDVVAAAPMLVLLRTLALGAGIAWGLTDRRWQGD